VKQFAALYDAVDRTTSTNAKVAALVAYFRSAPPADAAWAVFFLTGRRLKRLLPSASLREWAQAEAALPEWLFMESYAAVGDFAELIALVLDSVARAPEGDDMALAEWVETRIMPLARQDAAVQREQVVSWWRALDRSERFVLNKVITGEFRVGVAQTLVMRALGEAIGIDQKMVAARLMGDWTPSAEWFSSIISSEPGTAEPSQPYPFFLASPLEADPATLGDIRDWFVEWKWDGIRAQVVRRSGECWIWSRGEELITQRFPEVTAAATHLPEVVDGEILAFAEGRPLPFSALQQRIGRQRQLAQIMRAVPVAFIVYDLLERGGTDLRSSPLVERRRMLEDIVAGTGVVRLSEEVVSDTWTTLGALRGESRARGVEGFMLKRRSSAYGVGRRRGDWWKWKIDPFTVDAVLIYAQPGSGKRASLLTDYTFGVWDSGQLVPVAKAYSGLSNAEIGELDRWIRRHTKERHGPVRVVDPVHVFELGFEAIAPSARHKSGIAVRFPRMLRWRRDKPASEADTLDTLRALLREKQA